MHLSSASKALLAVSALSLAGVVGLRDASAQAFLAALLEGGAAEGVLGRAAIGALERGAAEEGLAVEARAMRAGRRARPLIQNNYNNTFEFSPQIALPAAPAHTARQGEAPSANDYELVQRVYKSVGSNNGISPRELATLNQVYGTAAEEEKISCEDLAVLQKAYATVGGPIGCDPRPAVGNARTECYSSGNAPNCNNVPPGWKVIRPEESYQADREWVARVYQHVESRGEGNGRTECYANGNAPNCDNVPPGWRVVR